MFIDYEGNLSDAQAETTQAAHNSTNVLDLQAAGRRIIDPWWYVFRIDTAIVSAGGGTLDIQFVTSAAAALSGATVLWDSGVIASATIVAWAANAVPYVIPVTYNGTLLRYVGVIYTIGTAAFTAGKWDMLRVINPPQPIL